MGGSKTTHSLQPSELNYSPLPPALVISHYPFHYYGRRGAEKLAVSPFLPEVKDTFESRLSFCFGYLIGFYEPVSDLASRHEDCILAV